ncbi:MAG: hypothetical protein AAGG44_11230, partial [Planctomycetota bacterium]
MFRSRQVVAATVWVCGLVAVAIGQVEEAVIQGWNRESKRPEVAPEFSHFKTKSGELVLAMSGEGRETVDGAWTKAVPIRGGSTVRFTAFKRTRGVQAPTRSALVKITWQDASGKMVKAAGVHGNMVLGENERARPEYPRDLPSSDRNDWVEVADVYQVPAGASQARVELRLRWTKGSVQWKTVGFEVF